MVKIAYILLVWILVGENSSCNFNPGRSRPVEQESTIPDSLFRNMPYPQTLPYVVPDESTAEVDTLPEFPGGLVALKEFIDDNLQMPSAARRTRITGHVYLSFLVSEEGEISDVQLLKGLGFGCDEEAMRIVEKMPNWKPAVKDGKKVSSRFSLPVYFGDKPSKKRWKSA